MGIKVTSTPRLQLRAYENALPETAARAVGAAATEIKREVLAGAPGHLSGIGPSARLTAVLLPRDLSVLIKAVGPWHLLEYDTKAHTIVSKKFGKTKSARQRVVSGLFVRAAGSRFGTVRGRGAVLTPQGPRAYVRHPGTHGKHLWARGVERATPAATLKFNQIMADDLNRRFS